VTELTVAVVTGVDGADGEEDDELPVHPAARRSAGKATRTC
jgi:hypothetical protein